MNQLLFRFWWISLGLFFVLTIIYGSSNSRFETRIRPALAADAKYENLVKIHPQVFTPAVTDLLGFKTKAKIESGLGDTWHQLLTNHPDAEKPYRKSFMVDNIWAFFLVLLIYTLALSPVGSARRGALIIAVLVIAYLLDFTENRLYVGSKETFSIIPMICALKMTFYLAGIALAIASLAGNIKDLKAKSTS